MCSLLLFSFNHIHQVRYIYLKRILDNRRWIRIQKYTQAGDSIFRVRVHPGEISRSVLGPRIKVLIRIYLMRYRNCVRHVAEGGRHDAHMGSLTPHPKLSRIMCTAILAGAGQREDSAKGGNVMRTYICGGLLAGCSFNIVDGAMCVVD